MQSLGLQPFAARFWAVSLLITLHGAGYVFALPNHARPVANRSSVLLHQPPTGWHHDRRRGIPDALHDPEEDLDFDHEAAPCEVGLPRHGSIHALHHLLPSRPSMGRHEVRMGQHAHRRTLHGFLCAILLLRRDPVLEEGRRDAPTPHHEEAQRGRRRLFLLRAGRLLLHHRLLPAAVVPGHQAGVGRPLRRHEPAHGALRRRHLRARRRHDLGMGLLHAVHAPLRGRQRHRRRPAHDPRAEHAEPQVDRLPDRPGRRPGPGHAAAAHGRPDGAGHGRRGRGHRRRHLRADGGRVADPAHRPELVPEQVHRESAQLRPGSQPGPGACCRRYGAGEGRARGE